jgi:hypothetical protein
MGDIVDAVLALDESLGEGSGQLAEIVHELVRDLAEVAGSGHQSSSSGNAVRSSLPKMICGACDNQGRTLRKERERASARDLGYYP